MNSIAHKIKQIPRTPYQVIAEKYSVSAKYVGMIARGEKNPKSKKGLKIKNDLQKLINQNEKVN